MPAKFSVEAKARQQWPCGPECDFARAMTNTYGEWLWCNHPQWGGRAAPAGEECPSYHTDSFLEQAPPLAIKRD